MSTSRSRMVVKADDPVDDSAVVQQERKVQAMANTRTPKHASSSGPGRPNKVVILPETHAAQRHAADSSTVTTPPHSASAAGEKLPSTRVVLARSAAQSKNDQAWSTKKGKAKKELITPLDYAQRLLSALADAEARLRVSSTPFLKGKRIYYYGGDMKYASEETRKRMEIIVKHGGALIPTYDPAQVTHIVTSNQPQKRPLLRVLGLKSLAEIPNNIPTVKWSWVASGLSRIRRGPAGDKGKDRAGESDVGEGSKVDEVWMDYEIMHASFKERLDAGFGEMTSKVQRKEQAGRVRASRSVDGGERSRRQQAAVAEEDFSRISEFTQDKNEPRESVIYQYSDEKLRSPASVTRGVADHEEKRDRTNVAGSSSITEPHIHYELPSPPPDEDPLAEFYARARAERDTEHLLGNEDGDSELDDDSIEKQPRGAIREVPQKRGFLCDKKGEGPAVRCANQDIIDKLQELMDLVKAKPLEEDRWRVFSYGKAIRALRSCQIRITSYEEARAIKGIGDKTARKIVEILETGDLRRIEHERTSDVEAISLFQGIYGVGRHIAFQWYARGCRTLDDVRARKGGIVLSAAQEIGLKYYQEINSRMPRSEAADIFNIIKPMALQIDSSLFIEIMGSYRRGKADCGDIDILITRPTSDGKTHQGILRRLLRELHERGIITEDLGLPDNFDDLELVYRGLCRRDLTSPRRRIDFLTIPYASRGAAMLYYTGDDIFNRSLRMKANVIGYSLNQRGLYAGVIRNPSDKRQKLNDGTIIASETEREIFDILRVPWQEPHERVRG
ncbi:uncharacterized protein LAESUDRAFT_745291 [Laetiporus sulphureus 93-53]|uniref:DNA polymerase lambda n=1 Tax=Laetiporus sulphureus 93-53 TaxID=1314785 RepID=A0A165BXJ9_9APHY|nr:uncharacterized protein LAESUDRAFT_745291 [Laetiporus sulphureus 93-53]KZT01837.1 hypothetical protein LAESUDRAFT_745291 [Laetiporus sulphureus 93-53]